MPFPAPLGQGNKINAEREKLRIKSGKEENVIHWQASAPSLPAGSCRASGLFSAGVDGEIIYSVIGAVFLLAVIGLLEKAA
jgi:hypothetical protein